MPALPPTTLLLSTIVSRNNTADFSNLTSLAANTSDTALPWNVICAWPVSGQYGPGSRILYYVLVAACVFARKAEWLRNACLAAALLFPAVAALHGIVLAALHVDGAVDMDIYGAFQFCTIGVLAAPVTVKLSRTYFNDPGRNIIFLWTGLLLAGLLSLTVEFYRSHAVPCDVTHDDNDNLIDPLGNFPYGNTTCNLICSNNDGPYSPMRQGATSEIFVIPEPQRLSFNTATLLAAASCIPAVLSLISMWNKILEINWRSRFGGRDQDEDAIEGTNGATVGGMKVVNNVISTFLKSAIEVPVFCAAVLAILIVGERNFWSYQVNYETEPVQSIGQWAPLVGTGLAVLGSLYVLVATDVEAVKEEENSNSSMHHCNCSHHNFHRDSSASPRESDVNDFPAGRSAHDYAVSPTQDPGPSSVQEIRTEPFRKTSRSAVGRGSNEDKRSIENEEHNSLELRRTPSRSPNSVYQSHEHKRWVDDTGHRRRVATVLSSIGDYLGTASRDQFDDSEFKQGRAQDFPEIPGEENRNRDLLHIREVYNAPRDDDGNITPSLYRASSRAGSFISTASGRIADDGALRAPSPSPLRNGNRAYTLPTRRTSSDMHDVASSSSGAVTRGRPRLRRDTLEVPSPAYHGPSRTTPPTSPVSPISPITPIAAAPGSESPPAIVVSDPDMDEVPDTPIINEPSSESSPDPRPSSSKRESPPL